MPFQWWVYVVDDGLDRGFDRYGDRPLSRLWRLRRLELAGEQSRWHEMPLAGGEPARDQILRTVQKDDADIVASMHEDVAIDALQRRAGDEGVLACLAGAVDLVGDRLQPGR